MEGNTGTPMEVELRFLYDGISFNPYVFEVTPAVAPNPPARIGGYPTGLGGATYGPLIVDIVPEPSTMALALFGAGLLLLKRSKSRSSY